MTEHHGKEIALGGLLIVTVFAMISAPDYVLLTTGAARIFHGLGLILGALGVALAVWLFVTGRVLPIPGKPASKMLTGLFIALTGAGMGYGGGRALVPVAVLMLSGSAEARPVVIETHGGFDRGSRLPKCRSSLPVAEGDRFAGQQLCMFARDFKQAVAGLDASRALVALEGRSTGWGVVYWRTTLVLPSLAPGAME